jgi:hypothetical protein
LALAAPTEGAVPRTFGPLGSLQSTEAVLMILHNKDKDWSQFIAESTFAGIEAPNQFTKQQLTYE